MSVEFQPRFGHAAEEFERYRPDYPRELFDHILAAVPSDPRQRAVDLGAGTGKSTRALLPYFREVIAIEPDPGMAAKLKEETPQVIVHGVTAEDFSQPDSTVDLVTVGNALHWMDLQRVFANAHSWLRPGGVFAVYDHPLPKTIPAVDAIVLSELRVRGNRIATSALNTTKIGRRKFVLLTVSKLLKARNFPTSFR